MSDIYRTRQRPGFVLVTVILVGALLFVSAFMFISQLTTESHVTKTDAYFKSALNVAETGLNGTLMDISQSVSAATWAQIFQTGGKILDAVASPGVHGTYRVTVVDTPVPDPVVPNLYSAEVQLTSEGRIYTPAVTTMVTGSVSSGDYAARRAVRTNTMATWTFVLAHTDTVRGHTDPPVYAPTTFGIKYGIFTGGDLEIKGSSQEIHGDVSSNGNVNIQKSSGLVGGKAYAVGTVTGGIPAGVRFPGQTPVPFPEVDIALMRKMFDAYVTGKYPYNAFNNQIPGAPAGTFYTCTNPLVVGNQRSAFKVDLLLAASSVDPVTGLRQLPSMSPITTAVASALIDPKAVYYFNGDVKLASNTSLSGTIAINGRLFISGNIQVGAGGTLANIVATGDVTKDTGCSAINALVYTGGSFTGRGTADINGALIARKSVSMNGNFNLTYNSNLPPLTIGGTLVTEEHVYPDTTTSYPDYYNLNDFKRPASDTRMWQEVTGLN